MPKASPDKKLEHYKHFHHLKQQHKKEYGECVKLRGAAQTVMPSQPPALNQTTLQNSFTRAVPYERKSDKWREITKAVAYRFTKDWSSSQLWNKMTLYNC
ncbi:hypothetical protein AMECASPLE_036211 [Ameca splendens]|uniref:Uncharacterized protein n=1 Tax=Ameca splendens TaxID=208324 RepID=A0ABV0XWL6_9TELE